jgi:hypothetical protein
MPVDYMAGPDSDMPAYAPEVAGAFENGFYEVHTSSVTGRNPHDEYLVFACDDLPTVLRGWTHAAVPEYHAYDAPGGDAPPHTFHLVGAHLFDLDVFGGYCPNDSHSWTAEECIRRSDRGPPEPCNLAAISADELTWRTAVHEMAHNIGWYDEPWHEWCTWDTPGPGQVECDGICDFDGDGELRESNDSILDYDCAYDALFAGYLSMDQIAALRQGNGVRQ